MTYLLNTITIYKRFFTGLPYEVLRFWLYFWAPCICQNRNKKDLLAQIKESAIGGSKIMKICFLSNLVQLLTNRSNFSTFHDIFRGKDFGKTQAKHPVQLDLFLLQDFCVINPRANRYRKEQEEQSGCQISHSLDVSKPENRALVGKNSLWCDAQRGFCSKTISLYYCPSFANILWVRKGRIKSANSSF